MKIGLLTFHDTNNFGSYLQTYGLYKKIKDLGYKCDVVDYQCESIIEREVPKPFQFTFNLKKIIIEILITPAKRKKYSNLLNFLHSNMTLSERVYKNTIVSIADKYDKFFVGSDIVWGLDITNNDTTYFLDFVKDPQKKFAFSSSIGNPWNENEKALVCPYLSEFTSIAVRENESAKWVEEVIGKRPYVVCDPTMLLKVDEWKKHASPKYEGKRFVLVYFPTVENMRDAKAYSRKYGIPCYVVNQSLPLKGVINVNPVTMEDFLSLFLNATFVFTGSYHGMLFSIYFNREFAYYNRAHKSRMDTLAKKLGVQNREGSKYDFIQMKPIDYSLVNDAVEGFRNYSIKTLEDMLAR